MMTKNKSWHFNWRFKWDWNRSYIIKTFKDNRMMDFCTPIVFGST